ncbi:MAG: hypothetical protein K9K39_06465 [Desulfohalobiaceae bacterium]|nr:hypothetical protein [Desulfohalobiaceae bacterium]
MQPERPPAPRQKAKEVWREFWSGQQQRVSTLPGFSMQGSLNIFTPKRNRRVTFELWGNPPTPLRLHLRAGIGTTISMWVIHSDGILIFSPRNNRAYSADNTARATQALGLRLPFTLPEMMQVLTGNWKNILWRDYLQTEYLPEERGYAFYPRGKKRVDKILLDGKSRVVSLSGKHPYEWTLERKDLTTRQGRVLSRRIELTTARDEELILRVKDFQTRTSPWPREDLRISLPPDTMVRSLTSPGQKREKQEQTTQED